MAWSASPSTPDGLRIDVYSDSTLEIFWERSTDDGVVIGYELIRNGQAIWLGDRTSYLDTNVGDHATYTYNLVAVDDDNNRSTESGTVTYTRTPVGNSSSCVSSCDGSLPRRSCSTRSAETS